MSETTENIRQPDGDDIRERFRNTLRARADAISSVRNDVFTTKWWQLVLNFFLGGGALATLIVTMLTQGTTSTVCAICGVVLIITVVVYNYALRVVMPMSFLQYTYIDKAKGKRYCFQILSKTRSAFSDGKNNIEVDRGEAVMLTELSYARYGFDFFADMDVNVRIGKVDSEIFKGVCEFKGKPTRCKIVFKNGLPLYGSVGGVRIKYFDVNSTKEKFIVPAALKRAVKGFNVEFPKAAGLYVRDDVKDVTKQ
mgnify:CR=1 FL=1